MRIEYYQQRFICRCSFEQRNIPKEKGFKWNSRAKQWFTDSHEVAARLEEYFDDSAKTQFTRARIKLTPWSGSLLVPPGEELYPFQYASIKFALERNRAYLALDPGLGKTAIAAITLNTLNQAAPTAAVYICPPFLTRNTEDEFKRWAPQIRVSLFEYKKQAAQCLVVPDSIVARQEVMAAIRTFTRFCNDMGMATLLIVDEAHRFKTVKALRTKALFGGTYSAQTFKGLTLQFDRVLYLSGTPMPNRPIELWPVLNASAPETIDFMTQFQYASKYCAAYQGRWGWDYTGASNIDELATRVVGTFMLRYRKSEVLKDLKPKTEHAVALDEDLNPRTAEMSAQILKHYTPEDLMREQIAKTLDRDASALPIATYRRQLGIEKVEPATRYLKYLLEETQDSVLVFAIHREVITRLAIELKEHEPLVITGDTKMRDRHAIVKEYQDNPARRVFIGNIQAAGTGFTLTKATRVVFVEFSWVPSDNEQASDRAHRIGQLKNVLVDYLVHRNSVDEAVINTVLAKKKITMKI